MVTRLSYDIIARDRATSTFDKVGRSVDTAGGKFKKAGDEIGKSGKSAADAGGKFDRAGRDIEGTAAKFDKIGKSAKGAGSDLQQAGKDVDGLTDKFKKLGKAGLVAAAAATGVAVGKGFIDGMDFGAANDKLAAQLGSNTKQAKKLGKVAADLYSGAWGDSMETVNQAVGGVVSSIGGMRQASSKDLKAVTASILDMASAFEIDVDRSSQIVGQMITTRLAKNGRNAVDLLTSSLQRVPAFVREDLIDAIDEYGPFMQTIGLKGEQAMSVLVNGAQKGMYGLDKTGDAIKELTIRATDMSTLTKGAFGRMGMDAHDMANDLLAGGKTGKEAFDRIVNGLLGIKDPATRANTAIALFGTPIEDLSVREIPSFLKGLVDTEDRLGKVTGASKRFGDTLNDNAKTKIETWKRTAQVALVNFLGEKVIPALESGWHWIEEKWGPAFRKFGRWFSNELAPALKDFAEDALGGLSEGWNQVRKGMERNPGLMRTLKQLTAGFGRLLTDVVLPAMGWWYKHYWPALGKAIGFGIDFLKTYISIELRMLEVSARVYKGLFQAATWTYGKILDAAVASMGWIPGLGPKIKKAEEVYDRFRDGVTHKLDQIANGAKLMRRQLEQPAQIEVRTDPATGAINRFITTTKSKFRDLGNDTYAIMVNGQSGHGRITKADGGFISGPGGPRDDRIPAALSNGEFVVNAKATSRNRPLLEQINAQKFADGGMVGAPNVDVRADMSEATAAVRGFVKDLKRMLTAGGGDMTAAQVARGQRAALSQRGSPYVWGGVGPGGFDCSGFQSFVYNSARGMRNPYHREFATSSMGSYANIRPGRGAYNVGWFTGNPGHTAGTIGGMNVESRGGDGVVVGPGARGAFDPLFNRHGHFTTAAGLKASMGMGGDPFGGPGDRLGNRSPAAARRYAQGLLSGRGWGGQFRELNLLWNRESGWRWNADNPTSSAYGIPQALPGSKMASAGKDWHSNPATQIRWGLNYIKDRYGTPSNAWAHSQHYGWYDGGGLLKPGVTRAVNTSGDNEMVLTKKEIEALSRAFKLSKGMGRGEVRSEFKELTRALRENLGRNAPLVERIDRMADVTLRSMDSTEKLRRQMQQAKQDYAAARQNMREMTSSAGSYYRSPLFGEGQGLSAFGNAKQLASGAKNFQAYLRRLNRKGLSDSLLGQIASSGDFDSAMELSKMSPQRLRRLNRLNEARLKAARAVGEYAGHAVYGDDVHSAHRRLRNITHASNRRERGLDNRDEKVIERAMRNAMHGAHIRLRDGGRDREADLLLRTGL